VVAMLMDGAILKRVLVNQSRYLRSTYTPWERHWIYSTHVRLMMAGVRRDSKSPPIGIVRSDISHPMVVTINQQIHASLGSMNSSLDDRKEKGGDSEIANRDIHLFTLQIWGQVVDPSSTWQPFLMLFDMCTRLFFFMAICPSGCMDCTS
jgi:hypothetical protein